MRRVFKKSIVIVLSMLLLLSLLPMTALADEEPTYPTITAGETKKVTPEEADGGMVYYQFTPTESGWYALDSSEEESRYLYAHLSSYGMGMWQQVGTWGSYGDEHFHLAYRFTEGVTYRFELECDSMSGPYSVTLYKPQTYTIRLHAGDGFFYDQSTGSKTDIYEDQIPADTWPDRNTDPQPNADGMSFIGWASTPDATIPEFDNIYGYKVTGDADLYALYGKQITVTYDANGGYTTGNDNPKVYERIQGAGTWFKDSIRAYYTDGTKMFVGWFTEKDGGKQYTSEDLVMDNLTVYAHWETMYWVTFDANGGYFYGEESQEQITLSFSESDAYFRYPSPTSKDPTLVFEGWYSQKDGGEEYKSNDPVTQSMTVYAHWVNGTPITYDANGGKFGDDSTTQTIYYLPGTLAQLGGYRPVHTDPKQVFIGWATTKDATKAEYSEYQRVQVDNISTLYAVYTDGIKITEQAGDGYFYGDYNYETYERERVKSIEFYVPSGATVGSLYYYYSGYYGTSGYIQAYTDQPHKGDFNYRSLTENGAALDRSYVLTKDTTLYVIWKDTATITFDAGDGYFAGAAQVNPPKTRTSEREIGVEHPINYMESFTPVSNDSSKAFIGWSESGKEADIVTSITPERDMTMKAVYKAGYKVTFESNISGSYWGRLNGQYFGKGSGYNNYAVWPAGIPFADLDLYAGANGQYIFLGFSTTKDGKNMIDANWYPTKDTTLYPIFMEGNEVYLETESGYFQSTGTSYLVRQVPKGQALGTVETPVSPGMVFVGWMEWQTQEIIDPKTFVPTDFTELLAVWKTGDQKYEWVTKGVNKNYTGIAQEKSGTWYYLKNGEPDFTYTGVKNNEYGWWRIENGIVNFNFNGLAANEYGTWYLKNGKVDFNYTGFAAGVAKNESGWWYVEKGQVKFNKTDILSGKANTVANKAGVDGWWYIVNSKVYTGNTVANNAYGWWVIRNGKVDFNYTGFASNQYGWWYAEKGQVTFKKNDILPGIANTDPKAAGEDGWWLVKKSQVVKETTVSNNAYGWWYVKDGAVDFDYNGVESNAYGWWCIHNGKVDFAYTGFEKNAYGWWYIEKGQVTFKKNDILSGKANTDPKAAGEDGWWLIEKSNVTKKTTVANNAYGWWYVKDGAVDFGYTGLAKNDYGTWYIEKGAVNFKFTGTYDGKKIVNGKVQ